MRIAIITFHRAYNCGAMLQAWALKVTLEHLGHSVVFLPENDLGRLPPRPVWATRKRTGNFWEKTASRIGKGFLSIFRVMVPAETAKYYENFRVQYLPECDLLDSQLAGKIDLIIVGSDQVINPKIAGWSRHFIGEGVSEKIPRIAYAASPGGRGALG